MRISILFNAFAVGVVCRKSVLGLPPLGNHHQRSIAVESDGSLSVLGPHDDRILDQKESREGQMDERSSFLVRGEGENHMYRIGDDDGDDEQDAVVHGGESRGESESQSDGGSGDDVLLVQKKDSEGEDAIGGDDDEQDAVVHGGESDEGNLDDNNCSSWYCVCNGYDNICCCNGWWWASPFKAPTSECFEKNRKFR